MTHLLLSVSPNFSLAPLSDTSHQHFSSGWLWSSPHWLPAFVLPALECVLNTAKVTVVNFKSYHVMSLCKMLKYFPSCLLHKPGSLGWPTGPYTLTSVTSTASSSTSWCPSPLHACFTGLLPSSDIQDMLCLRAFAPSSGPFPKVVLLLRSTSLPPSPPSAWFGHLFEETLPEWDWICQHHSHHWTCCPLLDPHLISADTLPHWTHSVRCFLICSLSVSFH